jgi:hypothetical protein
MTGSRDSRCERTSGDVALLLGDAALLLNLRNLQKQE